MRLHWLCSLAAACAALFACDTGPSTPLGGGGACAPVTSDSCTPTMQCAGAGMACRCLPGFSALACNGTEPGPAKLLALPPSGPERGTCCDTEGLTCGGFGICAPLCRCEHGRWTCWEPDCPLFFCPAQVSQLSGLSCDDRIGDTCTGVVGGCTVFCECQMDAFTGSSAWGCSEPKCSVDAGIGEPIDSGLFDAGEPTEAGEPIDGGMP